MRSVATVVVTAAQARTTGVQDCSPASPPCTGSSREAVAVGPSGHRSARGHPGERSRGGEAM